MAKKGVRASCERASARGSAPCSAPTMAPTAAQLPAMLPAAGLRAACATRSYTLITKHGAGLPKEPDPLQMAWAGGFGSLVVSLVAFHARPGVFGLGPLNLTISQNPSPRRDVTLRLGSGRRSGHDPRHCPFQGHAAACGSLVGVPRSSLVVRVVQEWYRMVGRDHLCADRHSWSRRACHSHAQAMETAACCWSSRVEWLVFGRWSQDVVALTDATSCPARRPQSLEHHTPTQSPGKHNPREASVAGKRKSSAHTHPHAHDNPRVSRDEFKRRVTSRDRATPRTAVGRTISAAANSGCGSAK